MDTVGSELREMVYQYRHGILPGDVKVICVPVRPSAYGGWEIALPPHQTYLAWTPDEARRIEPGETSVEREKVQLHEILTGPRVLYAGYGPKSRVLLIGKMEGEH